VLDAGKSVLIGAPGIANRSDASALLDRGSTLVLYTDGLVEDRNTDVDAGIARLCELVAGHDPAAGLRALCDRLLEGLAEEGQHTDDAALIVVRIADDWGPGH
jgi:serine phosphatase RsbU (regulator of sigma subunit)